MKDSNAKVCLFDAKDKKHNVLVLDTTKGYDLKKIVSYVKKS